MNQHIFRLSERVNQCKSLSQHLRGIQTHQIDEPFTITFCGRFKTGKSSLINAILGINDLPTKVTTATAVITKVVYGKKPKAYLIIDNTKREISFTDARDYILFDRGRQANKVYEILFEIPSPLLERNIVLVDTPGLDDDPELEKLTLKELENTDLCIVVYDAASILSMNEVHVLDKIQKLLNGNLMFIINRINFLNSVDDLNTVLESARHRLKNYGNSLVGMGTIYHVCSAEGAIQFNGFDKQFTSLLRSDKIHSIQLLSRCSMVLFKLEEILLELDREIQSADSVLSELKRASDTEINNKKRKKSQEILKLREQILTFQTLNRDKIPDEQILRNLVIKQKSKPDWQTNFNNTVRSAIFNHCNNFFAGIKADFLQKYQYPYIQYPQISMKNSFQEVRFPNATAEKSGWKATAVCGGALTIVAPGFGTAVGMALGKYIDHKLAGKEAEEDAVQKAMFIIRTAVIPKLNEVYSNIFTDIDSQITKYALGQDFHSDNESKLNEMNDEISDLKKLRRDSKEVINNVNYILKSIDGPACYQRIPAPSSTPDTKTQIFAELADENDFENYLWLQERMIPY